jgi:hypothetical protein
MTVTKTYCDVCNSEMTNKHESLFIPGHNLVVLVRRVNPATGETVHLCTYCLNRFKDALQMAFTVEA